MDPGGLQRRADLGSHRGAAEDVTLSPPTGAGVGEVVRDTPLGHYREVLVRVGEDEVRVYTDSSQHWSGAVDLRFERLVSYDEDRTEG